MLKIYGVEFGFRAHGSSCVAGSSSVSILTNLDKPWVILSSAIFEHCNLGKVVSQVAVKSFEKSLEKSLQKSRKEKVLTEVDILSKLHHPLPGQLPRAPRVPSSCVGYMGFGLNLQKGLFRV